MLTTQSGRLPLGSLGAALGIGLLLLAQNAAAIAGEVTIWAGGVLRPVLNELGPQFEGATGHKFVIEYGSSPEFARHLAAGRTFDAAFLVPATIDDWIKQGKIVAGSRTEIARVGSGIAVRSGASKPEVGSAEAVKQALLNAKSVAYASEGPTRAQLMQLLDRLGIAGDMQSKLKPFAAGSVLKFVAQGDGEMALAPIPSILTTPGVENAGPLPPELQTYLELTAGIGTSAKEAEGAKALIKVLAEPAAIAVIKAKGLEEPFRR